jgi:hypothetical protein
VLHTTQRIKTLGRSGITGNVLRCVNDVESICSRGLLFRGSTSSMCTPLTQCLLRRLCVLCCAACSMLALGGAVVLDDVRAHVLSDLSSLLVSMDNEALPARRAKVEAQVSRGARVGELIARPNTCTCSARLTGC